ncbi:glycosyltransferase [Jannaschia sp.]|nr:glycosyltransferase [Jannaschia sp.]
MITVTHLVDDTGMGGVTRLLNHLADGSDAEVIHVLRPVPRGRLPLRIKGDVIVSHLSISWRTLPALVALRATIRRPLIHVEHSYTEAFAALHVAAPRRFRALLATGFALFDRVLCVSPAQRDWLARLAPSARLGLLRPSVDVTPFLALPAPTDTRVIGAIGRLHTQKGLEVLIDAIRGCTLDLRLEIIGDGPDRAALIARAASDPRIVFPGAMDPVAAMARLDVVAMPSRWEAYGLVGLEARAAGRPLLVAPIDGLADQVTRGAVAVPGATTADWRAAMATVQPSDPTIRAQARSEAAAFHPAWAALVKSLLRA